jgi:hypothetical protein
VKQSKKQREYADCPSGRMAERTGSFQGHPEKFLVGKESGGLYLIYIIQE